MTTSSDELLKKLTLTLRCADADLKGVEERYEEQVVPHKHAASDASTTREEIADLRKELDKLLKGSTKE